MSVDANLAKQLEEIIQTGLERVAIPYQKGNSIRIKNMVIRGHKNGYRLFDITNNKHVTTHLLKLPRSAKLTAEDADFKMKDIIKLDDKVAKHYMDALYAQNTIKWEVPLKELTQQR